jgi:uncharacterized membrane protein YphA (DoxX/SURF4 family)
LATVLLLVALRIALGWHFFGQGMHHYRDPDWSSEGFLRQAKGPWAEFYKSKVPDFHGFNELVAHPWREPGTASNAAGVKGKAAQGNPAGAEDAKKDASTDDSAKTPKQPTEGEPTPPTKKEDEATKRARAQQAEDLAFAHPTYGAFARRVADDWNNRGREIAEHYGFSDAQKQQANTYFAGYKQSLLSYLASIESDLNLYQRELSRLDMMKSSKGAAEIPFETKRLSDKQREVAGMPGSWLADLRRMERGFEAAIGSLATDEQQELGQAPRPPSSLKKSDRFITWAMIICGGCLIVGLFTRVAALACATFLVLVMASQPPWVPGAFTDLFPYQLVELVALLALATTAVGRWGGLDFFVHSILTAPFRSER